MPHHYFQAESNYATILITLGNVRDFIHARTLATEQVTTECKAFVWRGEEAPSLPLKSLCARAADTTGLAS